MQQAIVIAEVEFGAWVERDQLYFPSVYRKEQWEKRIAAHDAAIHQEEAQRFTFAGKRWCGAAIGWREV
jgi:hypothetical protein